MMSRKQAYHSPCCIGRGEFIRLVIWMRIARIIRSLNIFVVDLLEHRVTSIVGNDYPDATFEAVANDNHTPESLLRRMGVEVRA